MSEFEKRVEVWPAFNRIDEGYGRGSCRIVFYLIGPKGAVQFMIGTTWAVPGDYETTANFYAEKKRHQISKPMGWEVGYHSREPMYEDQPPMECSVIGGECFYDGSGLRADKWVDEFVVGGTEWLWPKMEEEYREIFEAAA